MFVEMLAKDSTLRDAYRAFLENETAHENSLERLDKHRNVDHQKGRVAQLKMMLEKLKSLEKKLAKGEFDGTAR